MVCDGSEEESGAHPVPICWRRGKYTVLKELSQSHRHADGDDVEVEAPARVTPPSVPSQLDIVSSPSDAACCLARRRRFSMLVVLLLWLERPPAAEACSSGLFHTCWA